VIPGARHEILMERDEFREQFWAAFDAFVPGTPDEFRPSRPQSSSAAEQFESRRMEPAVAGSDDRAAPGG
jgi:lysophospholipase